MLWKSLENSFNSQQAITNLKLIIFPSCSIDIQISVNQNFRTTFEQSQPQTVWYFSCKSCWWATEQFDIRIIPPIMQKSSWFYLILRLLKRMLKTCIIKWIFRISFLFHKCSRSSTAIAIKFLIWRKRMASSGDWTHDHRIKSPALLPLSYRGFLWIWSINLQIFFKIPLLKEK